MKRYFPAAISLLAVVFTALAIQSCTKDQGADPALSNPKTTGTIDSTRLVDVKYSEDIKPLMTTYCLGTGAQRCHVSNSSTVAPGDFTSYDELKQRVDEGLIEYKVFGPSANMPPTYSTGPKQFDATDLAVFKKWVSDGAPNN
ncbi:MAG: hypothetical protein V4616_00630 [Bacteroidota bacterium]